MKKKPLKVASKKTKENAPKMPNDNWEAKEAVHILKRAEEIKSNKKLMAAAKREAKNQAKALSKISK